MRYFIMLVETILVTIGAFILVLSLVAIIVYIKNGQVP
jgi:hypothetical protein